MLHPICIGNNGKLSTRNQQIQGCVHQIKNELELIGLIYMSMPGEMDLSRVTMSLPAHLGHAHGLARMLYSLNRPN